MARKNLLSEGEVRQFMKLANLGNLSENYFTKNPLDERDEDWESEALSDMDSEADREGDEIGDLEGEVDALEDEGGEEISAELEDKLAQGVEALAAAWGIEDRVDVEGGEEGGEDLDAVDMEMDMGGEEIDVMDVEEEPAMREPYQEAKKKETASQKKWGGDKGDKPRKFNPKTGKKSEIEDFDEGQEMDEAVATGGAGGAFRSQPATSTARGSQGSGVPTGGGRPAESDYDCPVGQKMWQGKCVSAAEHQKLAAAGGLEEEIDDDAIVAEVARRVAERLQAENRKEAMADQLAERIFARLTQK